MDKRRNHMLLLIGVVLAVFGNSLLNGFVWDDNYLFIDNIVYERFQWRQIFLSLANGLEYLPLRDLSIALDHALWGKNPAGFHFTNLLLYVANVLAVYFLSLRLYPIARTERDEVNAGWFALLTALLFAVHPLHSEAANFITCRNVLLSGLFFFLSCTCYLRFLQEERVERGAYWWSLLLFFMALLSKATVIILPLFLLLFSLWHRRYKARDLRQLAPFFLLSAGFYLLFKEVATRANVLQETSSASLGQTVAAKVATAAEIPFFYMGKLLLPVNLSVAYDFSFATSLADPLAIGAMVGLAVLVGGAFALRKKEPLPLLVLGLYLVALLPVLNFFATTPIVADRYVYLASFPFAFFLASCLTRMKARMGTPAIAAFVVFVVAWSSLSLARNTVWKDRRSLWQATVKTSPGDLKARLNLIHLYYTDGDYRNTFKLLAELKNPSRDYQSFYRGLFYERDGNLQAAAASYQQALEQKDDFMAALAQLGHVSLLMGNYDQAMFFLNRALESRDMEFYPYQGKAKKDREEILRLLAPQLDTLRGRVAANPGDPRVRGELAVRLDSIGLYAEALDNYKALEKTAPASWQLPYNIANVYRKQRNFSEASRYYEKSIALNSQNPDALNSLAMCREALHDDSRAMSLFKQAIALDRESGMASFNLAALYLRRGEQGNAIDQLRYTAENYPRLKSKADGVLQGLQRH